jgi:hypothetical protein
MFDVWIFMCAEYLQSKRLLGGLLLLFPHDYGSPTDSDSEGDGDDNYTVVRKHIAEVEQWLIHNNLPVCTLGRNHERGFRA